MTCDRFLVQRKEGKEWRTLSCHPDPDSARDRYEEWEAYRGGKYRIRDMAEFTPAAEGWGG